MRTITLMLSLCFITMLLAFAPTGLLISSSAFTNNGAIPSRYSCEGDQDSPPLHISNIPATAKSLALILHDPDAPVRGGFTHWVVWNLDTKGDIPMNFKGGEQGLNSAHKKGYVGMCPPSGTHHYHFMAYALDTKLQLPASTDKEKLEQAMKGHVLAQGDLIGLYQKKN